jgi:hypothetical protein
MQRTHTPAGAATFVQDRDKTADDVKQEDGSTPSWPSRSKRRLMMSSCRSHSHSENLAIWPHVMSDPKEQH